MIHCKQKCITVAIGNPGAHGSSRQINRKSSFSDRQKLSLKIKKKQKQKTRSCRGIFYGMVRFLLAKPEAPVIVKKWPKRYTEM